MTTTLSDVLETKYVLKLIEQSWTDNEYGDWQSGSSKVIKEFKDPFETQGFLGLCNSKIKETQRKYHGKISYTVIPMYLRVETTAHKKWTFEGRTQQEIDAEMKKFDEQFRSRQKDNTYVG